MTFIDHGAADVDRYRNRHGVVDHIVAVQAANPAALDAHLGLYKALMFGASPLSRAQRELLALVVSTANGCHY
jgi:alkylhydroperoxidase family enzyme